MSDTPLFVILAEGLFGPTTSKTANSCIRYSPQSVCAVIDSVNAGKRVSSVLGFGGNIPVVGSLAEAMQFHPTALLVGVAPLGGTLPPDWRVVLLDAIDKGLDIWNGLHFFLSEDEELKQAAEKASVRLVDLRKPPPDLPVANGRVRDIQATIVLTVGTDSAIGKMTAALQVRDELKARGNRVAFAATGQTGILIEGRGIAVDAVVSDFVAGAAERVVLESAAGADIILVEGQGSIAHPGFSGVSMGLLHGSMPHAMVLCSVPSRTHVEHSPWSRIPSLASLISLHEELMTHIRPSRVIAVCLNTYDLTDTEARVAIEKAEQETGLPVTDPVRFDPSPVANSIHEFHRGRVMSGK